MAFPIPEGVSASFPNVRANVATSNFSVAGGPLTITFRPADVNSYCVLTMYDSGNNVILTKLSAGYARYLVPAGGGTYYFKCTADVEMVAATETAGAR
jgi:hypothetical protein